MSRLGVKAYRFSPGWGRLYPEPGRLNQKGLDFYERLVDGLLEAGIQPWLTVFHMEEPLWLARRGGFVRREAVDHLVEMGTTLFRAMGDRVKNWITINEPTIHAVCGYFLGEFPRAGSSRSAVSSTVSTTSSWATHGCATPGLPSAARGDIGIAHHSVWITRSG